MGEDRAATCLDKRASNNGEMVVVRHRNPSSVISSSCSEDTESESLGHIDEEDKEQELEYGPGIVHKLKTRFLSISLKQNRGAGMRRSCSMENLLEQSTPVVETSILKQPEFGGTTSTNPKPLWGQMKRAKSMDTLLLEMEAEANRQAEISGDATITTCKKTGIRRRELIRTMPTISDEELPKPDTVKTYKRMFEPAESKRGSYCRKPPVLRASAKSGAFSSSNKINGTNVSAKASVVVTKNKFISAKQSNIPPIKAQSATDSAIPVQSNTKPLVNGYNVAKPFLNGENQAKLIMNGNKTEKQFPSKDSSVKPFMNGSLKGKPVVTDVVDKMICNGKLGPKSNEVKSQNLSNNERATCNGNITDKEKELNSVNSETKKDVYVAPVKEIISIRNNVKKEPAKTISNDSMGNHIKNRLINHNDGQMYKPRVPPNKPTVLKSIKPNIKQMEPRKPMVSDRKTPPSSKLKNKLNTPDATNGKPQVNVVIPMPIGHEKNEAKVLEDNNCNNAEISPPPAVTQSGIEVRAEAKSAEKREKVVKDELMELKRKSDPVDTKTIPVETREIAVANGQPPQKQAKSSSEKVKPLLEIEGKVVTNALQEEKPGKNFDDKKETPTDQKVKTVVKSVVQEKSNVIESNKSSNGTKMDSPEIKCDKEKPFTSAPKKAQNTAKATSMVFDFRGKDVVPQVALLPVPFGCKALHPKKRPLLIDGKEATGGSYTNGIDDETDEDFVDYSLPLPCGVVFEGENVKVGKGSILATRNKDLKIQFDDDVDNNTFVYPSEISLLEESDRCGSPAPSEKDCTSNGQSAVSKLKSNTSISSSSVGGFSSYTPSVLRTMDNFQPGMFRPAPQLPAEEEKGRTQEGEEENTDFRENGEEDDEMLKPADPDLISSWSLSAGTSDLLF